MSATPDSTLANPEQLIADLERQLAECRAERDEAQQQLAERTIERDEAHAQQTATAEVLQVINSSPGDLTPVFDAVLEKATRVCDAVFGTLLEYDGEHFRNVAVRNVPAAFAEFVKAAEVVPFGPGTAPNRLLAGEQFVHVIDGQAEEAYSRAGRARALIDLGGARTWVSVALRKDDALLGAITIYRQEVRPFTDKQIALLQNFAAQAVSAMENARLITETREALEQQTATAEVLQVINSSPGDLGPVFDAILEKARGLCDAAHGTLTIRDGEHFRAVALHAIPPRLGELVRQPFPPHLGGPAQLLLQGERLVHIPDIRDREVPSPLRQAAIEAGIRTMLIVPLRKDDALLGYITVDRFEVRQFSDKEIALLENFAAQAVIAMENARLLTETREALEQQTATAEVLQVINSSPGDLTPVFDAMLEKATRLCEAPFGHLRIWDGECFHLGAAHGDPRYRDWFRQRGPIRSDRFDDASPLGRL